MKINFRKLVSIILTTLLLVGVGLAYLWFSPHYFSFGTDAQRVRLIQREVTREIETVERESETIRSRFDTLTQSSFSSLNLETQHPYFVFQEGNLVFWSDYRMVPDYASLAGNYHVRMMNLTTGKYLVHRFTFPHQQRKIEVFSLIPLYRKYHVENDYLQSGFNRQVLPRQTADVTSESVTNHAIYAPSGTFLFSVQLSNTQSTGQLIRYILSFLSGILTITLASWGVLSLIGRLRAQRQYELAFLLLAGYLVGIRAIMLYFNLPSAWIEVDLFSSKFYAASEITPSLGDLLLNVLVVFILIVYGMQVFFRSRTYRWLTRLPRYEQVIVSFIIVGISHWLLYLHFYVLRTIYLHSQLTLDITVSIEFSVLKIICLLIFALTACGYFLAVQSLGNLFIRLNRERMWVAWLLVGTTLYAAFSYAMNIFYPVILVANLVYFFLVIEYRLPKFLYYFKYITSVYLFTAAVICAAIGAYAVYNLEQRKHVINQQRFGEQLLVENDALGEVMLSQMAKNIEADAFIKTRFLGPQLSAQAQSIELKIRRAHLDSYFDKYDVIIHVYNALGEPVNGIDRTKTYWEYVENYRRMRYTTSYDNLYFVNALGEDVTKQYLQFITITQSDTQIGHIIVELTLKKIVPNNVYPELLVDRQFVRSPESRNYSYAIYEYGDLLYSEGNFNYQRDFDESALTQPQIISPGVTTGDYLHVAVPGERGKQFVVSAVKYPLKSLFTNFSFLFLVLVLCVVIMIIVYVARFNSAGVNTSFATKIQVYLNVAFFLPLAVVSIATIGIVSSAYRSNLGASFLEKSENISNNIRASISQYINEEISYDALASKLTEVARYSGADINVFDRYGQLAVSSQPLIYEDDLLSRYINPQAYIQVTEQNDRRVMIAEEVGKLRYNSVYVSIKSPDDKELLGIISIPFFESRAALNGQITEVLSTIVNIFTAIFICFLIFSYFASRILTVPLRLITAKIQKTTLTRYNEPVEWESDDEIGLLVGEYNRMLVKLEENKQALTHSEKESAWREMAQQVAHEIKNPLTPMKLTLQHLQRMLQRDEHIREQTERPFNTLLDQVDTLSDIATSFSAFAKMPIPKEEMFEITSVLYKTIDLYGSNGEVELTTDIPDKAYFVKGDQHLMSRIFTNLILNGIQSVPAGRVPRVYVGMQKSANSVCIEIRDNGAGISEAIQHKIFIPNFSTKYAGSGIGLAMAKRGVEHAGGRIWFETEESVGTSFFIELPVTEPDTRRNYVSVD